MTPVCLDLIDYVSFLQCERRLWRSHRRDGSSTTVLPSAFTELLDQRGRIPGAFEALLPGAQAVRPELGPQEALDRTARLLADPAVGVILGGLLERAGVRARADALERTADGRFLLHLQVADFAVRELDLDRAALLAHLLQSDGRQLAAVRIWHLDEKYRRDARGLDWRRLVQERDVSADVRLLVADLPSQLQRMQDALAGAEPEIEPSPHCLRPVRCEHWAACTATLPEGALVHLPRLRAAGFHGLRARGIARIAEIPEGEPLEPAQALTRAAWQQGRAVASPALIARLEALGGAVAYLDFETAMPLLPLLPGCGALEPLPVLWSLLVREPDGARRAAEFVAQPGVDPREPFARALIDALGDGAQPIAVYSLFEANAIERLEQQLPALASPLRAIRARLVDFLELVREHVAHPAFAGSYSLKRVAPVLCPGLTYADLSGVANGADAARLLDLWVAGGPLPELERSRAALLAYCARDVEALWHLHDALRALAQ